MGDLWRIYRTGPRTGEGVGLMTKRRIERVRDAGGKPCAARGNRPQRAAGYDRLMPAAAN